MNINSKYNNEEILKNINDKQLKKWAEFLDSKGILLLEVKDKGILSDKIIKFLSTKSNIVTLSFLSNSKFVKFSMKEFIEVYIYLNEKNMEDAINEKYDGIVIGGYFKYIDISYDNYIRVFNILLNYTNNYSLDSVAFINNNLVVTLYKFQSNILNIKNREYLYLIFDENYENHTETTEKPKPKNCYAIINHGIIGTIDNIEMKNIKGDK